MRTRTYHYRRGCSKAKCFRGRATLYVSRIGYTEGGCGRGYMCPFVVVVFCFVFVFCVCCCCFSFVCFVCCSYCCRLRHPQNLFPLPLMRSYGCPSVGLCRFCDLPLMPSFLALVSLMRSPTPLCPPLMRSYGSPFVASATCRLCGLMAAPSVVSAMCRLCSPCYLGHVHTGGGGRPPRKTLYA